MITKTELTEYALTHQHAGNGFAMVEDIDKEYCRVVPLASPITQAFLVWKPKLKVTTMSKGKGSDGRMLPPEPWTLGYASRANPQFMEQLAKLRRGIKSGAITVEATRFVEAT